MAAADSSTAAEARIRPREDRPQVAGHRRGRDQEPVYVLPKREETVEDFEWVLKEIRREGGEGLMCDAELVDGLTDNEIVRLFHAQCDAHYADAARQARNLLRTIKTRDGARGKGRWESERARLRETVQRIAKRDFFDAKGGQTVRSILDDIDRRLKPATRGNETGNPDTYAKRSLRGRTWVTRANIFVDRMASAWLVRRFIDPRAKFRFVDPETYRWKRDEIRFDTYEGEFTHRGGHCTFEVLCDAFHLHDPALSQLAEIVHDIDMKDGRYAREEAPGVALALRGFRSACQNDEQRLALASDYFDAIYKELTTTEETSGRGPNKRNKGARTGGTR